MHMANSYNSIRDLAWRVLLEHEVGELPVRVSSICRELGIALYTFKQSEDLIHGYGLWALTQNNDGFLVRAGDRYSIFYNGEQDKARSRFTVAHELGHYYLKHRAERYENISFSGRNREPREADARLETEANMFAARLLAPACVLWALDAYEPRDIAQLCGISLSAAQFRARRLENLDSRKRFLSSSLEQQVYEQFLPFIYRRRAQERSLQESL